MVKADDFVYSFNRLTDKAVSSPGAWVMNNVDFYEAINDSTFFIRLKTPFPPFLGLLTMPYCSVVPQEIVLEVKLHGIHGYLAKSIPKVLYGKHHQLKMILIFQKKEKC